MTVRYVSFNFCALQWSSLKFRFMGAPEEHLQCVGGSLKSWDVCDDIQWFLPIIFILISWFVFACSIPVIIYGLYLIRIVISLTDIMLWRYVRVSTIIRKLRNSDLQVEIKCPVYTYLKLQSARQMTQSKATSLEILIF